MKYTVKIKGEKSRPATPQEVARINKMMRLSYEYWKWQLIRGVSFIALVFFLVRS